MGRKNIISLLFSCLSLLLLGPINSFTFSQDRDLESAYRTFFSKEFGYTLIGEKPVSIEDGIESEYLATHPTLLKKFLSSLQQTFSSSRQILLKIFWEGDFYWIEMIHKPALKKLIGHNRQLRHFIRGKFGS